ncbi:hypothetical protein V7S43_016533 [Phytophthora oleae]|uniref:Uncharacterized protein n=1 Tax=Phytophthora oleae TaxID=2107226 RepID=A0ABD3EV63_9STRA
MAYTARPSAPKQSPSAQTPQHARAREPPQLERAVVSRTRFNITLLATPPPNGGNKAPPASEADQRGWSSPHGEPYRPLGRPELHLKFSPHLVNGVSSTMQNAHRVRALEGRGGSEGAVVGTGPEKATEAREVAVPSNGVSIATLVDQFVASMVNKRPLSERQVKLAHRLQANVGGFSPENICGLHRHKPCTLGQYHAFAEAEKQLCYDTSRGDKSLRLLREAIEKGTGRLRSTRNGINFLQHVDSPEIHWLHELHEQYLHARTNSPKSFKHCGSSSGGGAITTHRLPKTVYGDITSRGAPTQFKRDEDCALDSTKSDDGQDIWYMPYTTRQLQRSPHRRLPSLNEFRVRSRDEKQPTRPLRASSNIKASVLQHRLKPSAPGFNHTSLSSARSSMPPSLGVLNTTGGNGDILEHKLAILSTAIGKGAASPFAMSTTSPSTAPSVPHLHNIEKLQAAVDALESIKCQQSARLTTALEILEQDRRDCLAGKFRSLRVCCDASEDLKRMRERSERHRAQRVFELVSKTADWYPEVLRRLVAREGVTASSAGAGSMSTGGLLPLHAAEHFIVQAVHRFTNTGCEFQPAQLYICILHLHPEDLELLQVQQLLGFIRNALHINDDEWTHFFYAHGLPGRIADFGDDRKDPHGSADGKLCLPTASTARVGVSALVTSLESQGSQLIQ